MTNKDPKIVKHHGGNQYYLRPFHRIHGALDRMFDDAYESFHNMNFGLPTGHDHFVPKIDISANEKEYQIHVILPGIDKKDVKVEVHENVLEISGEKKHESEEKKKNFTRIESDYGYFKRSIQLPENIEIDNIDAEFQDGVLNLRIPKNPDAKQGPKQISIK